MLAGLCAAAMPAQIFAESQLGADVVEGATAVGVQDQCLPEVPIWVTVDSQQTAAAGHQCLCPRRGGVS